MFSPRTSISPLLGITIPKTDLISVVFPDPFVPKTAIIPPFLICKSTPLKTMFLLNCLCKFLILTILFSSLKDCCPLNYLV